MINQLRRYAALFILLLLAAGWVFLMSLSSTNGGSAVAADGAQATITWLDLRSGGFPRVEVHLSLVDQRGEPVLGLPQSAFRIEEDDFPATTQTFLSAGEQAVVTALVIDRSGSMDRTKMNGARDAADAFIDQMRPDRDQASLIVFDDRVQALQPLTNDQGALRRAVNSIHARGGTALYDGMYQGLLDLQGQNGRRILLALTDGLDNASRRTADDVIDLAQREGISIYTIGLGQGSWWIFADLDSDTLRRMAMATNGEYHQTPSAAELAALYRRIAQVVQNEYVLGYDSPTPQLDGTTRQVEIIIEREGGNLAARGSYAVSGVISSSFNAALFIPLFVGLLLFLLLLLFLPSLYDGWQKRRAARLAAQPLPAYLPYPQQSLTQVYYPQQSQQPGYPSPPLFHGGTEVIQQSICPHCQRSTRAGIKFCNHCGKSMSVAPPPMPSQAEAVSSFCRHCGKPMRPNTHYCAYCGKAP